MQGEIVTTQTEDRVRLHGLYASPVASTKVPFDALVLTHGLAGNFYGSRFLNYIAHAFLESGLHVVVGNTRGHDDVNRTVKLGRSVYLGAAFEQVNECRFDLAAWTDFLVERGHQRIVLAGHSLGAIKSLFAQARAPHERVAGIIGFSATRLNYEQLMASEGRELFVETMNAARRLVSDGQPDHLMRIEFPFRTMMAAGAYIDKYGPSNEYDWLQFIDRVTIPACLLFGELELNENPAFRGLRERFDDLQVAQPNLSIGEIEGADHFYSARYAEAARFARHWLEQQQQ